MSPNGTSSAPAWTGRFVGTTHRAYDMAGDWVYSMADGLVLSGGGLLDGTWTQFGNAYCYGSTQCPCNTATANYASNCRTGTVNFAYSGGSYSYVSGAPCYAAVCGALQTGHVSDVPADAPCNNQVVVEFLDPEGNRWRQRVLHISELAPGVSPGTRVAAGQLLAHIGHAGWACSDLVTGTGSHAHIEVYRTGGSEKQDFGPWIKASCSAAPAPGPCGASGQACCAGSACNPGLVCSALGCVSACGRESYPCCAIGAPCVFVGERSFCQADGYCAVCGRAPYLCCPGPTPCLGSGEYCDTGGGCAPCGGRAQRCCKSGVPCSTGLSCYSDNPQDPMDKRCW